MVFNHGYAYISPRGLDLLCKCYFPTPSPENLNHLAHGMSGTEASLERPPKWVQYESRKWTTAVRRLPWSSTKVNCPSGKISPLHTELLGKSLSFIQQLLIWMTDRSIRSIGGSMKWNNACLLPTIGLSIQKALTTDVSTMRNSVLDSNNTIE